MFRVILYNIYILLLVILCGCVQTGPEIPDDGCVLELVLTDGGTPFTGVGAPGRQWDYRYYIFNSHTGELMRTRDVMNVEYYKEMIVLNQVNYKANIYVVANHIDIPSAEFSSLTESELLGKGLYLKDNSDPMSAPGANPADRPIVLGRQLGVLLSPDGDEQVKVKIPVTPAYARLELDIAFKNGTPTSEELDAFFVLARMPLFSWLWPGKGAYDRNSYGTESGFIRQEGNRIKGELLMLENEQGIVSTNRSLQDMIDKAPRNATKLTMGIGERKHVLYVGGEPDAGVPLDFTSYNVRRGYRYAYRITIDIRGLRPGMRQAPVRDEELFVVEKI